MYFLCFYILSLKRLSLCLCKGCDSNRTSIITEYKKQLEFTKIEPGAQRGIAVFKFILCITKLQRHSAVFYEILLPGKAQKDR